MVTLNWAVFVTFGLLITFNWVNAADTCYSGRNNYYSPKQCSSGGNTASYTCQKFVCEGGKSPFTLRTCANANTGCIAGPRICQFSGGHGQCQRCNENLCNK